MAEDINNPGSQSNQNITDGLKSVTDKLNQNDKTLAKIAESSNDTGDKIGDLLKRQREANESLKDIVKNLKGLADSNKKMLEASEEEKRESQKAGGADSEEAKTGGGGKVEAKAKSEDLSKKLIETSDGLTKSLARFQKVFLTSRGLSKYMNLAKASMQNYKMTLMKQGLRMWRNQVGPVFAAAAGLFMGAMSTAVPKLIGNLRMIFGPIAKLANKFKFGSQVVADISKFFGRLQSFSTSGSVFMKTLSFIKRIFGPKSAKVFISAFKLGAQIGKLLPFLAIVPTAIETVVAAFGMIMKGDFKGAFKAVFVGLLKGVAAFFTFGLSDLIFDFDRMFKSLSEPLDAFFSLFKDLFQAVSYPIEMVMHYVNGFWNDFLKPVFNSLVNDMLKPIGNAIGALGDAIMSVVGVIISIVSFTLKPVTILLKIAFKIFAKIFTVLYDYVFGPMYKYVLGPIVMGLFKLVGAIFDGFMYIFNGIKWFFDKISFFFNVMTKIMDLGGDDAVGILDNLWENLQVVFQIIYKIWDIITDYVADALLWWWDVIKETWEIVYKIWDTLTDLLADGILIWVDWIKAAWKWVKQLWDDLTDALAYGMLWWWDAIKAAWDYVVGLFNEVTDALAYGMLWWKDLIDEGIQKVTDIWNFIVDALAEALEPIIEPINEFFDTVKSVWDYLVGKVKYWASWFGLGGDDAPASSSEPAAVAAAPTSRPLTYNQQVRREQRESQKEFLKAMKETDATGEYAAQMRNQINAAGGAAGGAGGSNMTRSSAPPIVINNSPTTNVGGGGGAMPVVISPTPVRNNDPTRGLINN